jgi:hypothetical protein
MNHAQNQSSPLPDSGIEFSHQTKRDIRAKNFLPLYRRASTISHGWLPNDHSRNFEFRRLRVRRSEFLSTCRIGIDITKKWLRSAPGENLL